MIVNDFATLASWFISRRFVPVSLSRKHGAATGFYFRFVFSSYSIEIVVICMYSYTQCDNFSPGLWISRVLSSAGIITYIAEKWDVLLSNEPNLETLGYQTAEPTFRVICLQKSCRRLVEVPLHSISRYRAMITTCYGARFGGLLYHFEPWDFYFD